MPGLPPMYRTGGDLQRKLLIVVLVLGLVGIMGRPLYWYIISDAFKVHIERCSPCECDCYKLDEAQGKALTELTHAILPNCEKAIDDPDMRNEVKMRRYQLLRDALKLREMINEEAQRRSKKALLDESNMADQIRKELMKCAGGMMMTQHARMQVEDALKLEKESSSLWEGRARALGWKD